MGDAGEEPEEQEQPAQAGPVDAIARNAWWSGGHDSLVRWTGGAIVARLDEAARVGKGLSKKCYVGVNKGLGVVRQTGSRAYP